jgi:hypothetical protein
LLWLSCRHWKGEKKWGGEREKKEAEGGEGDKRTEGDMDRIGKEGGASERENEKGGGTSERENEKEEGREEGRREGRETERESKDRKWGGLTKGGRCKDNTRGAKARQGEKRR